MPKRNPFLLAVSLLCVVLVACGSGSDSDAGPNTERTSAGPSKVLLEGTILDVARGPAAMIVEDSAGRLWSVSVAGPPVVVADRRSAGSLYDLLPGFSVAVQGIHSGGDRVRADTVRVVETPPVVLTRPREGVGLTRPLIPVSGHAVRGTQPSYRLSAGDEVLAEGRFRNEAFGARPYGSFRTDLSLARYDVPQSLMLEVWVEGSDVEPLRRTVRFASERTLTLYFPSRSADPGRLRCNTVYPVARPAPVLLAPDSVVAMLMADPPAEARARGMYSELSRLGELRSVTIGDGTADVRLDPSAEESDDCALRLGRAQVEQTLKEAFGFGTVRLHIGSASP